MTAAPTRTMTETQRLIALNDIVVDVQITKDTCYIDVKYPDPTPCRRGEYTSYISQSDYQNIQNEIDSMISWLAEVGDILS